jgi:hypothetical protein
VKPQRILFYRAGVSEGDFDVVLSREVAAIRKVRNVCLILEATTSIFSSISYFFVYGNTMSTPESAFMTSERKRSLDSLLRMAEVTAAYIARR